MRKKKRLLFVTFLLALASLMAAMSFSYAKIDSSASFSVKSTNEALLALIPGDDYKDNIAKIVDGKLVINIDPGVQKESEYLWNNLFSVKNNTNKSINVTVKTNDSQGNPSSTNQNTLTITDGQSSSHVSFTLNGGETKPVNLNIITKNLSVNSETKFTIIVEGKKN